MHQCIHSPNYHRFFTFASIIKNPSLCLETFVSRGVELCCAAVPAPPSTRLSLCAGVSREHLVPNDQGGFVTGEQSLELSRAFISTSCTLTVEQCLKYSLCFRALLRCPCEVLRAVNWGELHKFAGSVFPGLESWDGPTFPPVKSGFCPPIKCSMQSLAGAG